MMFEVTAGRHGQKRFAREPGGPGDAAGALWLLCRAGATLAALQIEDVVETMRVLPHARVEGAPPYILGLSIVRGLPAPVVDVGRILNGVPSRAGRLVTVKRAERIVALAVDEVVGITAFAADTFGRLPPLLRDAATEAIAGVGAADAELLVFLRTGRLVPEDVLADLTAEGAPT
jgi:purine-binding chemotaxis protein CheW